MSDTPVIERRIDPIVTNVPEKPQVQSLGECVMQSLGSYMAQLTGDPPSNLYDMVLEQVELPLIRLVMDYTGNNQSRAAKILGLSRGTLRKKLKIYDLL